MLDLVQIQAGIHSRTSAIEEANLDWPCRKGCADCCRNLAAEPRVSASEWCEIDRLLNEEQRHRIRAASGGSRICPLLDPDSSSCLIYDARLLACRAYGFYAERREVLGCSRIEAISGDVIWGNYTALEARIDELGPRRGLSDWVKEIAAVAP